MAKKEEPKKFGKFVMLSSKSKEVQWVLPRLLDLFREGDQAKLTALVKDLKEASEGRKAIGETAGEVLTPRVLEVAMQMGHPQKFSDMLNMKHATICLILSHDGDPGALQSLMHQWFEKKDKAKKKNKWEKEMDK